MPGQFLTDDLAALLVSSEFGETGATYQGSSVMGIFDDEDVEVQMGEGVAEIIPQPMFTGRSADFASIARGQTIVIRSETFKIKHWNDDSTGMIDIYLERT